MKEELKIGLLTAQIELQRYRLNVLREEIDDNISQLLSSINMMLGITGKSVYPITDIVKKTQGTLTLAIQNLRALSNSLNDNFIDSFDLIESLKAEVGRLNYWKEANITFAYTLTTLPLSVQAQLILFLSMIEILVNNIKNSKKKAIMLYLRDDEIEVVIKNDNGIMRAQMPQKSKEKVESYLKLIGGTIDGSVGGERNEEIVISLPVNSQSL